MATLIILAVSQDTFEKQLTGSEQERPLDFSAIFESVQK